MSSYVARGTIWSMCFVPSGVNHPIKENNNPILAVIMHRLFFLALTLYLFFLMYCVSVHYSNVIDVTTFKKIYVRLLNLLEFLLQERLIRE